MDGGWALLSRTDAKTITFTFRLLPDDRCSGFVLASDESLDRDETIAAMRAVRTFADRHLGRIEAGGSPRFAKET